MNPDLLAAKVFKIVVTLRGADPTTGSQFMGTGFFIDESHLLTCFHVAFGSDLKDLLNNALFLRMSATTQKAKLEQFYKQEVIKTEVISSDGQRYSALLESFNEEHDTAIFNIEVVDNKMPVLKLITDSKLAYGQKIFFGGFPAHFAYPLEDSPFAFQEGIVSSFITTEIGGGRHEHIQINAVTLGGISGAPIFTGDSDSVIGMVNGNYRYNGAPYPIAFATPSKLLS